MTNVNNLSRRGLLKAGAALGVGAMVGGSSSAFAADRVFVPYSNKSLDYIW